MQLCMYTAALFSAGYWDIKSVHLIILIYCKYMFFGLPNSPRWHIAIGVRPSFINTFFSNTTVAFFFQIRYTASLWEWVTLLLFHNNYVQMIGFNIGVNTVKFMHFCKKDLYSTPENLANKVIINKKKNREIYTIIAFK